MWNRSSTLAHCTHASCRLQTASKWFFHAPTLLITRRISLIAILSNVLMRLLTWCHSAGCYYMEVSPLKVLAMARVHNNTMPIYYHSPSPLQLMNRYVTACAWAHAEVNLLYVFYSDEIDSHIDKTDRVLLTASRLKITALVSCWWARMRSIDRVFAGLSLILHSIWASPLNIRDILMKPAGLSRYSMLDFFQSKAHWASGIHIVLVVPQKWH